MAATFAFGGAAQGLSARPNPMRYEIGGGTKRRRASGTRRRTGGAAAARSGLTVEQKPANPKVADANRRKEEALATLAAENAELDLKIARELAQDKETLARGDMKAKLAEVQDKQMENFYKAWRLTADKEGNSEFAGKLWDDLRWAGGKTKGTIVQGYKDEQGNRRLRLVAPKPVLYRDSTGAIVSKTELAPVELDGAPVDFSVDALEARYGKKPEASLLKKVTLEDNSVGVLDLGTGQVKPATIAGKKGVIAKTKPKKTGATASTVQEYEWLLKNGVAGSAREAVDIAKRAKSDPRKLILDLYAKRRQMVEENALKEPEDQSLEWAKRAVQQAGVVGEPPKRKKDALDQMPEPGKYAGRVIRDTETGKRYRSDGKQWVPLEE